MVGEAGRAVPPQPHFQLTRSLCEHHRKELRETTRDPVPPRTAIPERETEELGKARSSLSSLASGADQELGRLEGMLRRIDAAVDVTTLGGGPRGDAADEYIEVPDRMIAADTPTGEDLPERVAPPPAIVAGRAP